jgi:hypothetical protein
LLSLPATFGALYLTVWIGHRLKVSKTHADLKDIKKIYADNPKCGFWVAELLNEESSALKAPKGTATRVARFFLVHDTKIGKMYQMNTKCTRWS